MSCPDIGLHLKRTKHGRKEIQIQATTKSLFQCQTEARDHQCLS